MNDLFSLAGKNILITGAAQGIGYLLATGLGRYGARIIVNDITPERAETAVTKLQQEGIKLLPLPLMSPINRILKLRLNISKKISASLTS